MSDVLFEALTDIERYQQRYPQCYDDLQGEIEPVKAAMSALLRRLDHPGRPNPRSTAATAAVLVNQNLTTSAYPEMPAGSVREDRR